MKILNSLEDLVKKIQGEKGEKKPESQLKKTTAKNSDILLEGNGQLINDEILSLTFSINTKNQLFIDGKWANNSIEMANIFAQFTHLLFSGALYENMFNYLIAIASINEKYFEFAQNASLFLQEKLEEEEKLTEEPIIRPSQVFNFNKQRETQKNQNQILDNDDDDDLNIDNEVL